MKRQQLKYWNIKVRERAFSNIQIACPVHHHLISHVTLVQLQLKFYVHSSKTSLPTPAGKSIRWPLMLFQCCTENKGFQFYKDSENSCLCMCNRIWCNNVRCGETIIYNQRWELRLESNFNTIHHHHIATNYYFFTFKIIKVVKISSTSQVKHAVFLT